MCVDDTNNGKEVCKKKKEGRNTIFNTHTRERILLKKTKKQTNQKKEHPTDRPTTTDQAQANPIQSMPINQSTSRPTDQLPS